MWILQKCVCRKILFGKCTAFFHFFFLCTPYLCGPVVWSVPCVHKILGQKQKLNGVHSPRVAGRASNFNPPGTSKAPSYPNNVEYRCNIFFFSSVCLSTMYRIFCSDTEMNGHMNSVHDKKLWKVLSFYLNRRQQIWRNGTATKFFHWRSCKINFT